MFLGNSIRTGTSGCQHRLQIRTARTFIKKMNMPCTIEAAGVTKEQFEAELDEMAAAALADRCTATNPQPVTVEDIKEIYRKAFIGKLP